MRLQNYIFFLKITIFAVEFITPQDNIGICVIACPFGTFAPWTLQSYLIKDLFSMKMRNDAR